MSKLKRLFLIALASILLLSILPACGSNVFELALDAIFDEAKEAAPFSVIEIEENRHDLLIRNLPANNNYVIHQDYVFMQGNTEVNIIEVAKQKYKWYEISDYDYCFGLYYNYYPVFDDVYCSIVLHKDGSSSNDSVCMLYKINYNDISNPVYYDVDDNGKIAYLKGGYIFFNNSFRYYNKIYEIKEGEIVFKEKSLFSEPYDPFIKDGRIYGYCKYNKQNYLFMDENFNYYYLEYYNVPVDFIIDDYVFFEDGVCINYTNGTRVIDLEKRTLLEEKYIREKYPDIIDAEAEQFVYNGVQYRWENVWVEKEINGKVTCQSELKITNIATNESYVLPYSDFESTNKAVYDIYSSLPFDQVFVDNDELYVVCGWLSQYNSVGSSKIVFKYNEESGNLEYIGYAPLRARRINKIYKLNCAE